MYRYSSQESELLRQRAMQFAEQVESYYTGKLDESLFQQLRLRNGVYRQRHAHMLRIAIPYGQLNSQQLHALADVARKYDRGYGHFTTRQNVQFNWPELTDIPAILSELAEVDMHAIQTSGSCIRNITTDHYAGVADDEIEDPRPWCELLRQWSTLHPEFNWLPRKFKFAVTGAREDRAVIQLHDIGLRLYRDAATGKSMFEVLVGGGMGRTPIVGKTIKTDLPGDQLLAYLQSIIRIYNLYGRRDHKYKSRIKILVNDLGIDRFRTMVENDFEQADPFQFSRSLSEIENLRAMFRRKPVAVTPCLGDQIAVQSPAFTRWVKQNTQSHRCPDYCIVNISLKPADIAPGDVTASQMDVIADIAAGYSMDEVRVTHEQNLVLPWVHRSHLFSVWSKLRKAGLATANIGTVSDMICCPGLDFCSLANAGTIPVSVELNKRFAEYEGIQDLGSIKLKMSGCMNACGHHHVGNIGILGVDKKGQEWYQVTLGGQAGNETSLGKRLGPAISRHHIVEAIERILDTYRCKRRDGESFNDTVSRIGLAPFKEKVYADYPPQKHAA